MHLIRNDPIPFLSFFGISSMEVLNLESKCLKLGIFILFYLYLSFLFFGAQAPMVQGPGIALFIIIL